MDRAPRRRGAITNTAGLSTMVRAAADGPAETTVGGEGRDLLHAGASQLLLDVLPSGRFTGAPAARGYRDPHKRSCRAMTRMRPSSSGGRLMETASSKRMPSSGAARSPAA